MRSTSGSLTSATGRRTSTDSRSVNRMSGNTSKTAVYLRPAPGALSTESIRGSPAG